LEPINIFVRALRQKAPLRIQIQRRKNEQQLIEPEIAGSWS
jgi:hypothetical protein